MKTLYILFLYLCIALSAAAQSFCQIRHFSVNNGLSQGSVEDIIQDAKGILWLSTWNGLDKFDGYTFKNYKAFPGDGCTLTTNRFHSIVGSQYNDIWCETYDGRTYLFDSQTERFIDVLHAFETSMQQIFHVNRIYSLKKGIAWIVCEQGYVFRVDEQACKKGEGITLYNAFNKNLKGKKIFFVYQDSEGDEWVLTDKGITVIGQKQIDSDFPFKFVFEHKGCIYMVSTSGKMAYYDSNVKSIKFMEIPYEVDDILTHKLSDTDGDSIFLGTNNGLLLFLPQEKKFQLFDIRTAAHPSNEVRSICSDRTGDLWVHSRLPGITRLSLRTGEKKHYQSPVQNIIHHERPSRSFAYEDREGTMWMIPQQGDLCYYDRESDQLKLYYTNPDMPTSLFAPYVRNFYIDRQGNLWLVGTRGLEKMSFFPQRYQLNMIDNGLETRAFLLDKQNRLWVASKRGVVRIYNADGSLKGYLSAQGTISTNEVMFSRNVYCFMEDKQGNIWIGTKMDGLILLEKKGDYSYSVQQFMNQPKKEHSLSYNGVYSIHQDSHGRIWVGTYGGGLNLISRTANGGIEFIHSGNRLKNYPVATCMKIRYFTESPEGVLMVGTTNGLLTFSGKFDQPEEIKFHRNIRIPDMPSSLASNDVTYIFTDNSKTTYVATFTGGINRVVSKNLLTDSIKFKTYTVKNGLSSDLVLSMMQDNQQNLWVVAENALSVFDPQAERFDNYSNKYFLNEISFSEATPTLDSQKQLVFGTDKGVLKIDPATMNKSTYVPRIVFTGLRIQGSQRHIAIDDVEELRLEPLERNVTFQFAAIDYVNAEDIEYEYRLNGLEEEWNSADKNRAATYINLSPGEYQLEIRSTNGDGVWTDNIRALKIKVLPTFWETYWSLALYIILFVVFTSAVVYGLFYIYRLRHQVDMEQQLSNIKLRFFTDISHELRTPLTLIASPVTEVLEHEVLSPTAREHLTLVHKNTERMLRLVNQILDFRKIQNKKMRLLVEETEIVSFLRKIMESFRLIAEEKGIRFKLEQDVEAVTAWIDRDKFEKIIFNLLSNAFKYTPEGKSVTIQVRTQQERLEVVVADEGIGIDPNKRQTLFQRFETLGHHILQPSSGIGLSLVRELIELHHGSIELKSELGVGSEFLVALPLGKKVYENDKQVEFILSDSIMGMVLEQESGDVHADKAHEQEEETEAVANNEEALNVLIVEDNKELRRFLRNILAETYTVIEAVNGQEGLEYALQNIPDLIISDVMMPVMDGLDMVKALKENMDTCHIPIILLSAKSSLDDRIAGLEQGIDDYITKPFSATYLKTRIHSLLHQRKHLQEIYFSRFASRKIVGEEGEATDQGALNPHDERFMQQVMEFMEEQMDNSELTIDDFADKLLLSRTVFYRKLKSIVGLVPVDFVREVRIKRAVELIDGGEYNFSQVAYMTGFNDPKYFGKCFKKQMGMTPSEYKKQKE